jgi:putative phosphoesterase
MEIKMISILIIGDFHYPDRADHPKKIFNYINKMKFDLILCTGDLTKLLLLKELQNLGTVKIVQGNMDWGFKHPIKEIIEIDGLKIGLIHGHQVRPRGDLKKLGKIASELGVNILVSGHTHAQSINIVQNNILLINPGSASGAWSFVADNIPSFIIMHIDFEYLELIRYQFVEKKLRSKSQKFEKSLFIK